MIEPDTQMVVSLAAAQWNAVMTLLAEGPYRIAAPLIASIQQQCQQYDRPMRVNGGMAAADTRETPE